MKGSLTASSEKSGLNSYGKSDLFKIHTVPSIKHILAGCRHACRRCGRASTTVGTLPTATF